MTDRKPSSGGAFAHDFDTALRFLTTIPLPWPAPTSGRGLAGAVPSFPLVGAIIGLVLVASGWIAGLFWPPLVQAVLVVVAWGILTGGLHLDGVSDTFDAVMSWRPRERKLAIMKDSHIGAMGTLALVAVLLLKVAFLADAGASWWPAVLLAPMLGRWAMIAAIVWFPLARTEGLGSSVHGQVNRGTLSGISVVVAVTVVAIAGLGGIVAFLLVGSGAYLLGRWWTRDLGGLTGDTYGALCEATEVMALAAITAAARFAL
ncbi:adenosylcobinamide-GDP ribazoletransferase [Candidatus Chloroploca asiatica]|uniref:Adenosylcobinamide-GDP ribazoletransferase n=1 Tax=Candidatus Chloroploca asiatica TaxID=1506545 RepID=A0A2H3KV65_9CHLR|nr:adenosylcobinamide-GDP ribazoletransferase [Candidatus Chloroploca asiatica]PDV99227.1 cobalamin 5'-phosphate synthase [Candidatus Chloroploca asiatica]